MKLRRDIASVPARSGESTWAAIIDLLVGIDSTNVQQLYDATTIMGTLLSEDYYATSPLTVVGDSHRLVIYLSYGQDALAADRSVPELGWNPTAGDWNVFVPCAPEHFEWATRMLATTAPRLITHGLADDLPARDAAPESSAASLLEIDWNIG